MGIPLAQIQIALITAYRADTTLQALMAGINSTSGAVSPDWNIFDSVPTNTPFPLMAVNNIQASTGTALTMPYGKANDLLVTLDILSQYPGFKEAQGIASRIDDLTNEQSFTLTDGFVNFYTMFDTAIPLVEKDGITRHLAVRYKMWTVG